MVSRKRARQEMEAEGSPLHEPSLLDRIRDMWEFANLGQYLFIFGKAVKVDQDLDIEDLETELMRPQHSEKLSAIGLALLKFVSSHRGLTPDLFDEYSRRQYQARLPDHNPFGDGGVPRKFSEFDVFTKIRVLYQLSQWTMIHSDRIRERMPEQKDTEQTDWRVEPTGWDAKGRIYFILDDNRLYRRTDPPPPPPPPPPTQLASKPKKNSKKAKAAARASKRRRVSGVVPEDLEEEGPAVAELEGVDDGFGGMKWECVAVTLEQYKEFIESIRRSRHVDEKELYDALVADVLPLLEQQAEERKRKEARRERELLALEKLATAKRSSRIASKLEKQREEEEALEAERKRQNDLITAKKEKELSKKMEQDREWRILTRERRLREREMKRILHEEELANLSEDSKKLGTGEARKSERQLKSEIEKHKQALEEYTQEEDWIFDCSVCGVNGENLDDGSHSIACEKCNVWQHSACLGVSKEEAERSDFQFICKTCKRRIEDEIKSANSPKITIKLRLGSSFSPTGRSIPHVNGGTRDHKMQNPMDTYVDYSIGPKRPELARDSGPVEIQHTNAAVIPPFQDQESAASPPTPVYTNGATTSSHLPPPSALVATPKTPAYREERPLTDNNASLPVKAYPHMSSPTHGNKGFPTWGFPPSVNPFPMTNGVDHPIYAPQSTSPRHPPQQFASPCPVSPIPPSSSGLSPTKNTPSRPMSSHSLGGTQVLPPITTLSPSPRQQDLCPPSKGMTPEQLRSNGHLVHQH
ncbi:MAG: hypothetical protein M1840_006779 [Geoglossum simile]|nr:MAG: hypothetical protein M1840_006779 [Geoglossum simile]